MGLSFVAATLSYYFVELPFLRRKRRDRAEVDSEARPVTIREPAPATTD